MSLQLLRGDIGLYDVPFSMYLLGVGMGTMLANLCMCGIVIVKSSFKITRDDLCV